jgi:hypothetical protein
MTFTCLVAVGVLISTSALAQRGGRQEAPPPASFTATSIPGVVAAGTKIELVAAGLQRTEGPVAMQDGSMLVSGPNSILKVDASDNVSTFVETSNQTNGRVGIYRGASSRCSADEETRRSACSIPPTR